MLNEGDRSLKSAMKKRKTSDDPDDSVHEVEDELETDLTKKRQKKTRKVTFDRVSKTGGITYSYFADRSVRAWNSSMMQLQVRHTIP